MKKYILVYVVMAVAVIAGFFLYLTFLSSPNPQEVDLIAVNDIAKTVEHNWSDIELLAGQEFVYEASAVDNSGYVVWSTDSETPDNLQDAIRQRCVILDITVDHTVVGQVFINTVANDAEELMKNHLATYSVLSVILLCLISILFLWMLHTTIIRPFQKLESFAHKISTGMFNEPLPMDKSNTFGLFTQSFDVMRASLLESRNAQRELEQAKKELVVSLSHDIKTPVTSIKLISELLLATNPDPAASEKLKIISSKADQISHLVNDMMQSALEDLGELKVSPVAQPSNMLKQLLKDADYRGLMRSEPVPQCMVDIDPMRIEQVFGNIIINSYKYADTTVDVAFAIDGNFLRMEIKDYGPGVEPEALELICNKYYRGESARLSNQEGEGLGLYVAKLLMEKMGGGLDAYNWQEGFCIILMVQLSK